MIIRFKNEHAIAVSELIVENLKTVNIRDYPEELVDALAAYKNPHHLSESAEKCDAFVAVENGRILGVAMLDGNRIANMFVHTRVQGRGIGKSLLAHIEGLARRRQISRLVVDSSITAVGFYTKCGYRVIREVNKPFCGIENIVFEMTKVL
jgi:GNAT superfamily N-acetyltransferase